MLCQFTFKNFKSYKKETTIEMQAENSNEFEDTLIQSEKDDKKYLPVAVIYGPNGGGKSNALEAMVGAIGSVIVPILLVRSKKIQNLPIVPYKFCDEKNTTDFEFFYQLEKKEYRYEISFLDEKIIYESLYILTEGAKKPTKIYIRDKENIELGEELKKEKVNVNNSLDIPFLSFLSISYDIETINKAVFFFLSTSLLNCDEEGFEYIFLEDILEGDEKVKKQFIELLNNMDIDIIDYRIEKLIGIDGAINIYTKHKVNDKEYELSILEESKGTQKLFALLPRIIFALKNGNLTVIDEMDAKLHPKLIQYIIELFKDKTINTKGAQLIISSHDLSIMSKDVLRRDEILFAAKDEQGSSDIYSLYEIRDEKGDRIRKNAAYNKQYIEGRYGADPYLKRILDWEVD